MGFETSKFGNGTDVGSGGNVTTSKGSPHNFFGFRDIGGGMGNYETDGAYQNLVIDFTGKDFNDGVAPSLVTYKLPAGTVIKAVYLEVTEVFVCSSDTTFGLEIGTSGTEATNGFTTTDTQLQSTGFVNLTSALSGTWDAEAPLAAQTTVKAVLSGTNSAVTDAGKAKFTIVYETAGNGV